MQNNKVNYKLRFKKITIIGLCAGLSACANISDHKGVDSSYLKQSIQHDNTSVNIANSVTAEQKIAPGLSILPSRDGMLDIDSKELNLAHNFSDTNQVSLSLNSLPVKDYLHYVFGELLKVNYVLGEQVKTDNKTLTLNIQDIITERQLFSLSEKMLAERSYVVRFEDNIYYIHKAETSSAKGDFAYGYGKDISKVPNTSLNIIQLVPMTYGVQNSLAHTLRQMTAVTATQDFERNTLVLTGKRKDIIRALELINLMDQPKFRNRKIGIYRSTYVSIADLAQKLPDLLMQEGLQVSAQGQIDQAVSLVPLERVGLMVVFANDAKVIERVGFWAETLDQAPSGDQFEYFIYAPKYARATDLGTSISALLNRSNSFQGGGNRQQDVGNSTSLTQQNQNKGQSSSQGALSASDDEMSVVVDERANALIIHTTGDKYKKLLPLIKRLDVMPKQVILEVMIAEVKLTDVFKAGVDVVLTNQGATKTGGFKMETGSAGLTYALTGTRGSVTLNLLNTNSNVNVLSRSSLLVRDGVTASIAVGDDIPTVGETISDPTNGSRSSVVYRKTGVDLQVKPTVNARGVVIMEIDQTISNQQEGDSSVAGSPIIFERSLSTEVVAESGQTIILGGLISENRTVNDRQVPFFSSIPVLGNLFDSTSDTKDKTELVVLVTPRVIESVDEWADIKASFYEKLSNLTIN
jgi:general secretion pathway protein D